MQSLLIYVVIFSIFGSILAVYLSLGIFYYWFKSLLKYTSLPKANLIYYLLKSKEEKAYLLKLNSSIEKHKAELDSLWTKGVNLTKRSDGYFQEKSKIAKELNPKIKDTETKIIELEHEHDQVSRFSFKRSSYYHDEKSIFENNTIMLITLILTYSYLLLYPAEWLNFMSTVINKYSLLKLVLDYDNLWGGALIVAVFVSYLISTILEKTNITIPFIDFNRKNKLTEKEFDIFMSKLIKETGIGSKYNI